MQPRDVHLSVRLEHLATTVGLTLACAGMLALLVCAAGMRGTNNLFTDWALLSLALAPASQRAWHHLSPLFWKPTPARDSSASPG